MTHQRATMGRVLGDSVRGLILAAYRAENGNSTRAAERLGVSRRTLLRWVERYDLRAQVQAARNENR